MLLCPILFLSWVRLVSTEIVSSGIFYVNALTLLSLSPLSTTASPCICLLELVLVLFLVFTLAFFFVTTFNDLSFLF
jgi:hypothetical protein